MVAEGEGGTRGLKPVETLVSRTIDRTQRMEQWVGEWATVRKPVKVQTTVSSLWTK